MTRTAAPYRLPHAAGLGRLIVFSIQNRDLPTLQAAILVVAAVYALANLLADLLYARFNPKIRFGRNVS